MNEKILFYVIPKYVNFQNKNDDCAISIRYAAEEDEINIPDYDLSVKMRRFIADSLKLPEVSVIPITEDDYFEKYIDDEREVKVCPIN